MSEYFEILWKKILNKSNMCGCNRNKAQDIIYNKLCYGLATKAQEERYVMDACCNIFKINLMDLKVILKKELKEKTT